MVLYAEQPVENYKGPTPDRSPIELKSSPNVSVMKVWHDYLFQRLIHVSVILVVKLFRCNTPAPTALMDSLTPQTQAAQVSSHSTCPVAAVHSLSIIQQIMVVSSRNMQMGQPGHPCHLHTMALVIKGRLV